MHSRRMTARLPMLFAASVEKNELLTPVSELSIGIMIMQFVVHAQLI